jgi:hypothetical protein
MTVGRIPVIEGGIQPTIFDAKADLLTATANDTPARLAVGSNGQVLTADSTAGTGLAWATPSAASQDWSLVSTTNTTSGTSVTITGLGTYKQLMIFFNRISSSGASDNYYLQFNSSASANYNDFGLRSDGAGAMKGNRNVSGTEFGIGGSEDSAGFITGYLYVSGCQSSGFKQGTYTSGGSAAGAAVGQIKGFIWADSTTISSIKVAGYDATTFDAGSITIYGSTN